MISFLTALDITFNSRNFITLGGISLSARSLFDGRKPENMIQAQASQVTVFCVSFLKRF